MANPIPKEMIENYFKIVFYPWLSNKDKKSVIPTSYFNIKGRDKNGSK